MRAIVGTMALAGTVTLVGSGHATTPAMAPETVPMIWVMQSGSYGGGSTSSVGLATAEWYETVVHVGDARGASLCGAGTISPAVGRAVVPDEARPLVTWRVAMRRQAFDGATATIAVRWSRDVGGPGIQPADDFAGTFTWRPVEGEERVLDFVRQVPPAQAHCETQSLTLRYRPEGPDDLRQAAIAYDIWLVQGLPSGERHTRHLRTTARQGDAVPFAFPPVGLDAPGLKNPLGPAVIDLSVEGQIRGRLRRDGHVDLAVDAGRMLMPRGMGLGSGSNGRTRLTVAQDETVELEPPPLPGNDGAYADALRNARTAIRVRVKRLW